MKKKLEVLLRLAVETLKCDGALPQDIEPSINIDHSKDPLHGDFASNLALVLAKPAKANPRQLAEKIVTALPQDDSITKVEIAGPGFINFFIDPMGQYEIIRTIHDQGSDYGLSKIGAGKRVQVEFVSANPTGPLHVGHGRGAAYGSVVADLLEAVGFDVHREYYVNDAGRQMDILATSIWLRYLEDCGEV
ncbi:MAG: arginine--tRNA ligase, partial [Methylococcaceae bacterium]|nr:arginine--tRNA ligase [Methylococcaceae bacterium]